MHVDDPAAQTLVIGAGRAALGAGLLLAPRTLGRLLLRGRVGDQAQVALRLFAGRELALGLGAAVAARRNAPGLRGWVEAGAVADAADVTAMVLAPSGTLRTAARLGGALAGTSATAWALRTADRLAEHDEEA
ncbi:MAG: hypothetical protein ACQETV_04045 [Actinomycetota bacterium]